ncbi:hypothetical protein [Burkholderia gladioli]|uniref:hypothetical protein n=1 Tax=Burkholderia gladioli TaxID=28095 RepID=UPI00164165B0|nr:hypothetical protein [Burkholderia gladioli]
MVAELASRDAGDIEAVWHALSEAERAQLRPLLVDAAALQPVAPEAFASMLLPAASHEAPADRPQAHTIAEAPLSIGRLAGRWPDPLLGRLAGCLDEPARARCLAAHPTWRAHAEVALTSRAREALLEAAGDAIRALPDNLRDAASAPTTTPREPVRWTRRLRDALRGRRA